MNPGVTLKVGQRVIDTHDNQEFSVVSLPENSVVLRATTKLPNGHWYERAFDFYPPKEGATPLELLTEDRLLIIEDKA